MKKKLQTAYIAMLTALMISCTAANPIKPLAKDQWINARITYYTPESSDGKRVAWSKVKAAKEGVTIAAHPKLPFGTKVLIPELKGVVGDGTFIVQDRGTAVTSRKASRGKTDVIDVFVNSERKLRNITKTKPEYMKIHIVLHK